MMNKKRTRTAGRIKYALFVPLAVALLIASNISCISNEKKNEQATSTSEAKVEPQVDENGVYMVCEEMPKFPGGMAECMKFLGKNIQYPTQAIENGTQSRVLVQFIVQKDGSITDAIVARGVDPLLDKEALRVINSMPKWEPGKHKGEAVSVKYTVPVLFRLGEDDTQKKEVKDKDGNVVGAGKQAQVDENGVYMVCDEMPKYPNGMQELMKFLQKNINYPEDCEKAGVQGRVIVQFVVDKEGNIIEPKVVRGIHESLDKEALRVIKMMPKWEPGKQDGKPVSVKHTVPIAFKVK